MGEETTWFDLLPGVKNLELFAQSHLERHAAVATFPTAFSITHVLGVALVLVFAVIGGVAFSAGIAGGGEKAIVPPSRFNLRNMFELLCDAIFSVAVGVMGEKNARKYFPIVGTIAIFIFFSNCLALIPGFAPPTATLKTNLALALTVFVLTHYFGFKENGIAYLKHFIGPVIYLAPLMFLIEIVGHIARPVSLSLRLLGNMAADHKVVAAFFALVPLLLPVPFILLGVLVCIIQTLVFTLLTMVYIQGAVAHEHGDDHAHDTGHH
jgi:F-type H+-transporting ATPase subunit a